MVESTVTNTPPPRPVAVLSTIVQWLQDTLPSSTTLIPPPFADRKSPKDKFCVIQVFSIVTSVVPDRLILLPIAIPPPQAGKSERTLHFAVLPRRQVFRIVNLPPARSIKSGGISISVSPASPMNIPPPGLDATLPLISALRKSPLLKGLGKRRPPGMPRWSGSGMLSNATPPPSPTDIFCIISTSTASRVQLKPTYIPPPAPIIPGANPPLATFPIICDLALIGSGADARPLPIVMAPPFSQKIPPPLPVLSSFAALPAWLSFTVDLNRVPRAPTSCISNVESFVR